MKFDGCKINAQFRAEVEMLLTTASEVILIRKRDEMLRTLEVGVRELLDKHPAKRQEKVKV